MKWILPLLILIAAEAVADTLTKVWEKNGGIGLAVLVLAIYGFAQISWLVAIRYGSGLARGGVIFSVASAILAVIIGVLIFKEPTTKTQIIGLLLGIISILLLVAE